MSGAVEHGVALMGSNALSGSDASIAGQVLSELSRLGIQPSPHAFAVWFTHLSGQDPALSAALRERANAGMTFTAEVVEELHETHILSTRTLRVAERSSRAVMMEIDGIVELIRLSLGSSTKYSSTLSKLLGDMVTTNDPAALKEIVSTLVKATEETRQLNETLDKGLRAARTEVDELRKVLEDTRLDALKDGLTGISNRRHFEQAMQGAIETATETRRQFALLMIDIDHFKQFNDQHGHLTGDKVLRVVAQALRDKFPARATVARYGGEEFAVILPDADLMAGWVGAEAARQSILARELVKRSTGEKIGRITISIGVGAWKRNDSALSLLSRSDGALLRAKRFGRNRTVTEDQMSQDAVA
jgi:diguanylate cyclase